MVEYHLGPGMEPKVTQGSQGAWPWHSPSFSLPQVEDPFIPQHPWAGQVSVPSLCLWSGSEISTFLSQFSFSARAWGASHCSHPFNSVGFSSFFPNLHSKTALHIPALISMLFFLKKNPSAQGQEHNVPHFVAGSVWWGRGEGTMSLWAWPRHLCHDKIQVQQSLPLLWSSSECPWMSWVLLLFVLFEAYSVQVTASTLFQLIL